MSGRIRVVLGVAACLVGCTPLATDLTPAATVLATASVPPSAPSASAEPTDPNSPSPSVTPSSTPDRAALEAIDLEVIGCPGGVVVDWSPSADPQFHHYIALRSIESDVKVAYPPIAPAVDWGDSYATDRFITSAVDATLIPSDTRLYYRVMAYDAENRPLAASPIRNTHLTEVESLGPVSVAPSDGLTSIDWGPFGGLPRCFSAYTVLIGPVGTTPTSTLTVVSDQATTEVATPALQPGTTYAIQVNAVRDTTLGSFVVGQSEIAAYTVP
jgi:hypothetical protein